MALALNSKRPPRLERVVGLPVAAILYRNQIERCHDRVLVRDGVLHLRLAVPDPNGTSKSFASVVYWFYTGQSFGFSTIRPAHPLVVFLHAHLPILRVGSIYRRPETRKIYAKSGSVSA